MEAQARQALKIDALELQVKGLFIVDGYKEEIRIIFGEA